MLKLVTYPAAFGAPSASPFGVKTMCLLNMSGAIWEAVPGDPAEAPKGKLPILIDDGKTIPDSEDIRTHLEKKFNKDFDAGLTAEQRAVSRAVIRMMDEHLYFAILNQNWNTDANWESLVAELFGMVPEPARQAVAESTRENVLGDLRAQGFGRHASTEQFARANQDITAVQVLLGESRFLFGNTPTAVDASAGPIMAAIAASPTQTTLSRRVSEDLHLMAYLKRVREALYPA